MVDLSCLLLCYNRFPALALEITCVILSIFGGIITYFGQKEIPFYIDSNIYKIVYLINIPYFILIILFNIIFFIFRYYDLMNNRLHLLGYSLSIVEINVAIFEIITNLINDALIITNMGFYKESALKKKSSKYHLITQKEWSFTKIILCVIIFIWANMLLITFTDNLLIDRKINGSFHKYSLAIKNENDFIQSQKNFEDDDDNDDEVKNKKKKNLKKRKYQNKNIKVNNNINNNININVKIDNNNNNNNNNIKPKRKYRGSVNSVLLNENNNMKESLKKNEEEKK